MKSLIISCIVLLFVQFVNGQDCLPDGITFTSQDQIDNFPTDFPDCVEIEGHLIIEGESISNLNGLLGLKSIGEEFSIEDVGLTSLAGLDSLVFVGGFLEIYFCDLLENILALQKLNYIGGDLKIEYNEALTSLSGLENLTAIGNNFSLVNIPLLNSLQGLENVESIDGEFFIADCNALNNLSGLNNLKSVGGDLGINSNQLLSTLTGLEGLESIGSHLNIQSNNSLTSLSSLSNVKSINGILQISNNYALTNLNGLDSIDASGINMLFLFSNFIMTDCDVKSICDYLANPVGSISIWENDEGCNSEDEVKAACNEASIDDVPLFNNFTISPNPFLKTTSIKFELHEPTNVEIKIYNHFGVEVYTIQDVIYHGHVEIKLESENLSSGIYYCILKTNNGIQTTKLIKL